MADKTGIEWTDATWNPIAGCDLVSPGCTNCYAMKRVAPRLAANPATKHYHGTVKKASNGQYAWTGKMSVARKAVWEKPLKWKRSRLIFVNSTSDLFHDGVDDGVIERVWDVMAQCPQHVFQILTKREQRMAEFTNRHEFRFLPNVWLGVSVENQKWADKRREHLQKTIAAVKFVSYEPALGMVNWAGWEFIDWLIAGGESAQGKNARPAHPEWFREARDWADANDVPFMFKQWGDWTAGANVTSIGTLKGAFYFDESWYYENVTQRASEEMHRDDASDVWHVGKKEAGRLLDGVEHNGMPRVAP